MAYQIKDIKEARGIVMDCQEQVNDILSTLNSIKNWSWADIIGDSFLLSWIKRDKIKHLNPKMRKLKSTLNQLQKELLDLDILFNVPLTDSNYDRIWDIWLDNIFTDVRVHNEIEETTKQIKYLSEELARVQRYIDQMDFTKSEDNWSDF